MAAPTTDPVLKSFVSTRLLFTRMDEDEVGNALEFLGTDADEAIVEEPAELVGV